MPSNIDPNDVMLMARTMWGENNNATPDEYAAIAHVMRNRLQSGSREFTPGVSPQLGSGNSMARIVLAPHQFQAWDNPKAGNYPMKAPVRSPAFQTAYHIANDVMSGQLDDLTHGAVNYYNPKAPGQKTPVWAQGRQGQQIGSHKFYGPAPQAVAKNTKKLEDFPDLANEQPAGGEVAGDEVVASGKPKRDLADYADLHGDTAPEEPPAPEQRPQNPTEDIAAAKQGIAAGQGPASVMIQTMRDLAARHPNVTAGIEGAAAANTGIPLAAGAAYAGGAGMSALPRWAQVGVPLGLSSLSQTAIGSQASQKVADIWHLISSMGH